MANDEVGKLERFRGLMKKGEMVREPNLLIEAKQKFTRDEGIVWFWLLANARFYKDFSLAKELLPSDIEELKTEKKPFLATSVIDLKELAERYPEIFDRKTTYYFKRVLKRMEKKVMFEVEADRYIEIMGELGYDYLVDDLKGEKISYFGIATILKVVLTEDGKLRIVFSPYISPLILELKRKFTLYEFEEVLKLQSRYAIILYRFFKEQLGLRRNQIRLSTEEVALLFNLEGNLKEGKLQTRDLKNKYLEPALKEINEKTSLRVDMKAIRRGRGGKIVGFSFSVRQIPRLPTSEEILDVQRLRDTLSLLEIVSEGELKIERTAYELLKLTNVNPAVALWYLLHFPKEKHGEVWEELKGIDANGEIKYPEKFLESKIPQRNENWNFLLSEQVKKLLRDKLKRVAKPYEEFLESQRKEMELLRIAEEIKSLSVKLSDEQKEKIKQKVAQVFNHHGRVGELVKKLLLEKDLKNLKRVLDIFHEAYAQELFEDLGF